VTTASPIQAVVLDFGGVLWNMRWDAAQALEEAHGLPRGSLFQTLYRTPTWAEIERGRGDRAAWLDEAHRLLETRAGRPLPRLHEAWRGQQHLIDESVALVRALRPAHRTAILSNNDASFRARLRDGLGILDLFDTVVSSAEEGIAKPEPLIYRRAAERLAVSVAACVFVDDAEPNVRAAVEVGMRGLLFRVDRGHDLRRMLAGAGVPVA
jgi:putative hydrolase of the HAD superfamily